MYNQELENLIDAALADGVLTEKEKQILFKKAQAMGVDLDEFEMVLDARLVKLKKTEEEKAASSAPKSNKLGDVKKCPACGAIVQSYQGMCPECGYAFEGIDANSAVRELSNLLQKTDEHDKMEKIIDTYPIPMDKGSLLAFITWLRPQSTDLSNPLAKAYYRKYAECVNKIKVSFSDDKHLQPFISYFQNDEKNIQNDEKKEKRRLFVYRIKSTIGTWLLLLPGILILFFILKPSISKNAEKSNIAIEKALKKGNTQKAINIFLDFKGKSSINTKSELVEQGAAESIIDACLADGNIKDAIRVGNAAGMKYDGFDAGEKKIASILYEYCIKHGDFETAKNIYQTGNRPSEHHGKYIKDVCTYLCENGKKDEAQRFLNNHKGEIARNDDLGSRDKVTEMIQNIINNY